MLIRLRATNEREQRSAARVDRAADLGRNSAQFGNLAAFVGFSAVATAVLTTTIAWTAKPCVPSTASMHGKYHSRRLQEFLT